MLAPSSSPYVFLPENLKITNLSAWFYVDSYHFSFIWIAISVEASLFSPITLLLICLNFSIQNENEVISLTWSCFLIWLLNSSRKSMPFGLFSDLAYVQSKIFS